MKCLRVQRQYLGAPLDQRKIVGIEDLRGPVDMLMGVETQRSEVRRRRIDQGDLDDGRAATEREYQTLPVDVDRVVVRRPA